MMFHGVKTCHPSKDHTPTRVKLPHTYLRYKHRTLLSSVRVKKLMSHYRLSWRSDARDRRKVLKNIFFPQIFEKIEEPSFVLSPHEPQEVDYGFTKEEKYSSLSSAHSKQFCGKFWLLGNNRKQKTLKHLQTALVIRGLFICEFAYSHWQNWSKMAFF